MSNKRIAGIIFLAIIISVIGISHKLSPPKDGAIQIGIVYGLTGPASVWSENGLQAAQMAVEEINDQGGINGKQIELLVEDSQTDPKTGISAFQKLITVDKVAVVIGDVWSFITNPLIPIAENTETVLISPTVMDVSVEKRSPYFFSMGHTVSSQEKAMHLFFEKHPEVKNVYDLCWNDAWGHAHSELLKKVAVERGLTIIGTTCTNDFSSDYRTEAAKIKQAQPDAVFLTGAYEDVAVKAMVDMGVSVPILTTTGIVEAIRARDFSPTYVQNVLFMDWTPNIEFLKKFKEKYGKYPIMEAQNHYEAVHSIVKAFENNPDDILEGLKEVVYEGVGGVIDFSTGDNIRVNKAEAKLYSINSKGEFIEIK